MSEDRPVVVGFTLQRARELLRAAGEQIVQVDATGPPSTAGLRSDGALRVVQQRQVAGSKVSLVIAREIRLEAGAGDSCAHPQAERGQG